MEHVSNEQKAIQIAANNRINYYEGEPGWGVNVSSSEKECYESAMQAMQWKDEQFAKEKQKLIDEACEWLAKNDSYAKPTHLQVDRLREHLNKQ
jgi:hypothetical protein